MVGRLAMIRIAVTDQASLALSAPGARNLLLRVPLSQDLHKLRVLTTMADA